ETKTITASVAGVALAAQPTVGFVAGPPAFATSSMTASPSLVASNGSSTATIAITARDANGNAAGGVPVALAVTGTGNALMPASGTTTASGTFTATLASTVAETKTINASVGSGGAAIALSAKVTFAAPADIASLGVTGSAGCMTVNYSVAQPQSARADVIVE